MPTGNEVSRLECGHLAYLTPGPQLHDIVYCRECRGYQAVTVPHVEWGWNCPTCHTGKRYGLDEQLCKRVAQEHLSRYPHHVVTIKKGGAVRETWEGPQESKLFETEP